MRTVSTCAPHASRNGHDLEGVLVVVDGKHGEAVRTSILTSIAIGQYLPADGADCKVRKLFSISTPGPPNVYDVAHMQGPPSIARPLVLIADDNCDTRDMYALYLSKVGYWVETAADGREAMAKAATMRPDLIVMDLQMPGVNGWRAMRDIRGNSKTADIPVIVLTGHDFKDYLQHSALAEGACSFLMKPCLPEDLAREISERLPTRQNRAL